MAFPIIVAFTAGLLVGVMLLVSFGSVWVKRAREDAKRIRDLAEKEAEVEIANARAKAQNALEFAKNEIAKERARLEVDEEKKQQTLHFRLQEFEQRQEAIERREEAIAAQEAKYKLALHEAEKTTRLYKLKLHRIAQLTHEEARAELLTLTEQRLSSEMADYRMERLAQSEAEVEAEAKRLLLSAMQRIASNPVHETSATHVKLKSDDEKGKIIGKEGRNIRAFELATGATLLIDDTPGTVLVSSFDPVRREIARNALEVLLRDGRINPVSIEETVAEVKEHIDARIIEWGESALRRLNLGKVPEEITRLVGRMHYRLSNNQNTLEHSIEVAFIASLLASELGLEPEIAKRAGLFHDMGKCISHEYEGSHAAIGAQFLRRHGEDARVINAVAAHHEEVPAESVYAPLLMVADALSSTRPGARSDSIDGYVKRIQSLEDLAARHPGVREVFAVQAGREIRVIVNPEDLDDAGAQRLARLIRNDIENELTFSNPVKITVIRESRFVETAK